MSKFMPKIKFSQHPRVWFRNRWDEEAFKIYVVVTKTNGTIERHAIPATLKLHVQSNRVMLWHPEQTCMMERVLDELRKGAEKVEVYLDERETL